MNVAAWTGVLICTLLAWGVPWAVGKFRFRWFQADRRWAAGAFGVLAGIGAGTFALGTFIGRRLVPWLGTLHPLVPVVGGLLFVGLVVYAGLAVLPDRWIAVPANETAIALGMVAPLLAVFAAWGIGDAATSGLTLMQHLSTKVTGWAR